MIAQDPYGLPTPETVTSIEGLLHFVWDRETIRLRRAEGLPRDEWTQDPVLRKYKFTNIHRAHDRVSQWIINHVILPNAERQDLWFILLICRLINWPPTLQRLIDDGILFRDAGDFNTAEFSASIEQFKAEAGKVYSGAYMVYPTKMDPGGVKSMALGKHIITPVLNVGDEVEHTIYGDESISRFVSELSKCFGISTFMAGQVAADLTYVGGPLSQAVDLYTYAPIGPGSSRGLNYLLSRSAFAAWTTENFNHALMNVHDKVIAKLAICDLTLHDVQNIMCEYSKYCRAVRGEGKPKSLYVAETEF